MSTPEPEEPFKVLAKLKKATRPKPEEKAKAEGTAEKP